MFASRLAGMDWLDDETRAWAEQQAVEYHGGDLLAFLAAVLRATRLADQRPDDPWAGVQERAASRWPSHRVPAAELIGFVQAWDPAKHGDRAADVLAAIRSRLGLPPG